MKKIILASAIALVCGSPLAFAAGNAASLNTQHCSNSDKGTTVCRQEPHKNDVSHMGIKGGEARSR
jgi:hypothetical protein